jgi:hypothetical protein
LIALGVFFAVTRRRKAKSGKENPYELPPSGYVQAPGEYRDAGNRGYYAAHQHDASEVGGGEVSEMSTEGAKSTKYRREDEATKQEPVELA